MTDFPERGTVGGRFKESLSQIRTGTTVIDVWRGESTSRRGFLDDGSICLVLRTDHLSMKLAIKQFHRQIKEVSHLGVFHS